MPHSLRAKLSGLRYKGILEDKDYKRLCHALDLEKAEQEPYICDACKHNNKEWDEEPCDGCCGNHSGYEPSGETVSLEAFKQVMWERDIAIEQLHELGYELGQKIEPKSPCDVCRYNPPSSADGKPCTMCPAESEDKE